MKIITLIIKLKKKQNKNTHNNLVEVVVDRGRWCLEESFQPGGGAGRGLINLSIMKRYIYPYHHHHYHHRHSYPLHQHHHQYMKK